MGSMLLVLAAVFFAIATPEQDGLLSYSVPVYALHNKGTVELNVDVDAGGNVTAVRPLPQPSPFLSTFAADAVRQWKFAPGRPRVEKVRISFEGERETNCESAATATYESPLTLHVTAPIAKPICVPPATDECAVHHEKMTVRRVRVVYGLPYVGEDDHGYIRARNAEFPNARDFVLGGCVIRPETSANVYVCESCRRAKQRWLAAHPGYVPSF